MWREEMVEQHGGDRKSEHVKEIKNDNVILDPKPEQGNSKSYALSRLKRERPDLFAGVCKGELTANRALPDPKRINLQNTCRSERVHMTPFTSKTLIKP